ncbi:MAG: ABC transporter substrate-binding protein [Oscillospiraceae bacterium]|nr:ABC transporter substrate-binding protein [Oscillospiraceae bacterium]
MRNMKKVLAILLVAVLSLCCFAACGNNGGTDTTTAAGDTTAANADNNGDNYAAKNTEYFIGATGPLTGDAAQYGISVQQGAQLAVEEINANGGLNGKNFKFDIKDDKAAAADAATGYDTLYEAGMQVSLGSVTSGSADSFAGRAVEDNVFFMTPSASAANVIADRSNAFRICFGDPDQGVLAAEELSKNYEKIGAIYDTSDPYSAGIFEAFEGKMKELGKDFDTQTFDAENKKDFSTQVEALKDCDVIFVPIYYTEAGLIAKAASAKGSDAVIFGCDGLDGVAEQIDGSVKNKVSYITPFDVNSEDAKVSAFVKAYQEKYGVAPDQFAADGYDAVMVIFEAMKKAGVDDVTISPSALCDILVKTITAEDFSFEGVTGKMTWDASGAPTKVPTIVEL